MQPGLFTTNNPSSAHPIPDLEPRIQPLPDTSPTVYWRPTTRMSDSCGDSMSTPSFPDASCGNDLEDSISHGFGMSKRLGGSGSKPSQNLPNSTPGPGASRASSRDPPPAQGSVNRARSAVSASMLTQSAQDLPPTCDPPASALSRTSPRPESSVNSRSSKESNSTPSNGLSELIGDEPIRRVLGDGMRDNNAGSHSSAPKSTGDPADKAIPLCEVDISRDSGSIFNHNPSGFNILSNAYGVNIGSINLNSWATGSTTTHTTSRSRKLISLTNEEPSISLMKTSESIEARIAFKMYEAAYELPTARIKLASRHGNLNVTAIPSYPDAPFRANLNLWAETSNGDVRILLHRCFLENGKIFLVLGSAATRRIGKRVMKRVVNVSSKEDAQRASDAHRGDVVVVVVGSGDLSISLER